MSSYWLTKKTLTSGGYKVAFEWLMEDVTDIMSDSISADIQRNPNRNRISFTKPDRNVPSSVTEIPANLGNYFYRAFVNNIDTPDQWDYIMDTCMLTVSAYHDDYDFYSDLCKDIYGVRPHLTVNEWHVIVSEARSMR